jgi:hypothetical protein
MLRFLVICGTVTTIVVASILLMRSTYITRVRTETAATVRELTVKPESVAWSGIYQRFRTRREAIAAMQADLTRLLAAESAFAVDSGHPTTALPPPYAFPLSKGNRPPEIVLRRDGWAATIVNDVTSIACSISITYASETTMAPPYTGHPECTAKLTPP